MPKEKPPKPEQPIIAFESQKEFEKWLAKHHKDHQGILMRIYKKGSDAPTVTYAEAVESALCYGWIDGQKNKYDEQSWLQKFTKRGAKSVWSKVNVGHIERLTKEGRMKPAGQATVDAAKADGRWDNAYASGRNAEMPEDFMATLNKTPRPKPSSKRLPKPIPTPYTFA